MDAFTYVPVGEQRQLIDQLMKNEGVSTNWAETEPAAPYQWLGGTLELIATIVRRHFIPLRFFLLARGYATGDVNCQSLYRQEELYAAGFAREYPIPVAEDALKLTLINLQPLKSNSDTSEWPNWFRNFNYTLESRSLPTT